MIDLGTGNNNKMCVSSSSPTHRWPASFPLSSFPISYSNWAMDNKQEVKNSCWKLVSNTLMALLLSLPIADWYHRNRLPWCIQRTWSRRFSQRFLPISRKLGFTHSWMCLLIDYSTRYRYWIYTRDEPTQNSSIPPSWFFFSRCDGKRLYTTHDLICTLPNAAPWFLHVLSPIPPTRRMTSIDYRKNKKQKQSVCKIWSSIICIIYQTVNKKSNSFPSTLHLTNQKGKSPALQIRQYFSLSLSLSPSSNHQDQREINHYPSSGRKRFIAPPSYPPFWPWINAGLTCLCRIPCPPRPTGIPPCFFVFNSEHLPIQIFFQRWRVKSCEKLDSSRIQAVSQSATRQFLFRRIDEETMTHTHTERDRDVSMPKCNRIAMQRRTRERDRERERQKEITVSHGCSDNLKKNQKRWERRYNS